MLTGVAGRWAGSFVLDEGLAALPDAERTPDRLVFQGVTCVKPNSLELMIMRARTSYSVM
jgi:hypothetical protein